MSVKGLGKLEARRKAMDFTLKVYREVLPVLPNEEKWKWRINHGKQNQL